MSKNLENNHDGLSVIICCHDSDDRIGKVLECLKAQKTKTPFSWEVVLVDNGKNEGLSTVCKQIWDEDSRVSINIVIETKPGLSIARTRGIHSAKYNIICFVDDDNWLRDNWVETAYSIMNEYPDVGACGGISEPVFEKTPPFWFELFKESYAVGEQGKFAGEVDRERNFLWGGGLVIRRAALHDLYTGGFEPLLIGREGRKLTSGEDAELCFSMKLAHWKIWYCPELKLCHFIRSDRLNWKYLKRLHYNFGASSAILHLYTDELGMFHSRRKHLKDAGWQKTFWSHIRHLLKDKYLLKYLSPIGYEGDKDVLYVERILGEIVFIFKNRKKYASWRNSIRTAQWNKSQTKLM